jgi:hypothetical protein
MTTTHLNRLPKRGVDYIRYTQENEQLTLICIFTFEVVFVGPFSCFVIRSQLFEFARIPRWLRARDDSKTG